MKIVIAGALGVLVALLFAGPAMAADSTATECPNEARGHPFADWGDDGAYFLAPGGDFESEGGWTFVRGAETVADTSPDGWGASVAIPDGAAATSPEICVAEGYTHGRLFGRAMGGLRDLGAQFRVDVLDAETNTRLMPSSILGVERRWNPTESFFFDEESFGLDPVSGLGSVRLRFTALGPATSLLDGVYIDPRARN